MEKLKIAGKITGVIACFIAAFLIAYNPDYTVEAQNKLATLSGIELPQLPEFETEEEEAEEAEVVATVATNRGRAIDANYASTPDTHDAITSEGNARAFAQVEKDNADYAAAQLAKIEVAEKPINERSEKSEELKAKEDVVNEAVTVVVEGDGTSEGVPTDEVKPEAGETVADNREVIDIGVIDFGDETTSSEPDPVVIEPEPAVVSEPAVVEPEPVVSEPEPVVVEPESEEINPDPESDEELILEELTLDESLERIDGVIIYT